MDGLACAPAGRGRRFSALWGGGGNSRGEVFRRGAPEGPREGRPRCMAFRGELPAEMLQLGPLVT